MTKQVIITNVLVGAAIVLLMQLITFNSQQSIQHNVEKKISEAFSQQGDLCKGALQTQSSSAAPATANNKKKEKKVISYGLYGADPKYTFGAIRNTELAKQLYPDWVCRFYVDNTVPKDIIDQLKENGSEVINMGEGGGIAGMFWRFLVAEDDTVDVYMVRDTDSRLNLREKAAVDEWLESGAQIHLIRDHYNHNYPINGGTWGGKKGAIKDLKKKIDQWNQKKDYMQDMNFLKAVIWPEIKDIQIGHDSYHCNEFPNSRPFPTRRFGWEHVGQVFDQNDMARQADIDVLIRHAPPPVECRKNKDWKYG